MPANNPLLIAHIGDLHLTEPHSQNYLDFVSILTQLETECGRHLDFVILPGDNADDGLPEQYELVSTALRMFSKPVYIITGDHDMASGNLDAFYAMPRARQLPVSSLVRGVRCLFLDMCGPGSGGPDFRLGAGQLTWLADQLEQAAGREENVALFMHTYPADCTDNAESARLNQLIARYPVVLVDMGHTHYNELANDGHTVFAATRSTGQIEEGNVGYSLVSIDRGTVSWRFKRLDDPFPVVLITTPADYRLWREDDEARPGGATLVRAFVLGSQPIQRVSCRLNQQAAVPMLVAGDGRVWEAELDIAAESAPTLTVEAVDEQGRLGQHTIELINPSPAGPGRCKQGSDADSIGVWLQNGILGTQLGPNWNGKAW